MATLFFFPSSGTADVSPTVDTTDWDGHVNTVSRPMNLANGNSSRVVLTYAPDGSAHLTDVDSMIAQFVSGILPAQTIPSQTVLFAASCFQSASTNNLFLAWKVYVVNAAGTSVLATLVPLRRDDAGIATAQSSRTDVATISQLVLTEPFRLVTEVGAGGLPDTTGTHNFSVQFGEASTGFPQSGASGTAANTMLCFYQDLITVVRPTPTYIGLA